MPFWVEPDDGGDRVRRVRGRRAAASDRRPWRWTAPIVVALLLAGGWLYARGPLSARAADGARAGSGHGARTEAGRVVPAGRFLFLHVYEASTHALRPPLPAGAPERAGWNADTRRLTVAAPEDRPRADTQVWVVAEQHSALRRLATQVHHVASPPQELAVQRPLPGVDNAQRLIPGAIHVLAVEAGGAVRLRFDGRDVTLAPGERARFGWYRDERGAVRAFSDGGEWQAAVDRAIAGRLPLTNLTIANLGLWDLWGVSS